MELITSRHDDINVKRAIVDQVDKTGSALINIGPVQSKRHLEQNKLYWYWNGCLSKETGDSIGTWHKRHKLRHLMPILCAKEGEYYEKVRSKYKAIKELKIIAPNHYVECLDMFSGLISTTKLTVKEFHQYLDAINVWAIENMEVKLPTKEDLINEGQWH